MEKLFDNFARQFEGTKKPFGLIFFGQKQQVQKEKWFPKQKNSVEVME